MKFEGDATSIPAERKERNTKWQWSMCRTAPSSDIGILFLFFFLCCKTMSKRLPLTVSVVAN